MKKMLNNEWRMLAAGLLLMNAGIILNYFIALNVDVIDFFKGMGIPLVLAAFWLSMTDRTCHRSRK